MEKKQLEADASTRREFMKKAGALAAYTPPVVIALMSPSRKALAASGGRIKKPNPGRIHVEHEFGPKGNNGLGQRIDDPQPPGLQGKPELWNDRPSSVPGQPNNKK